MQDRDLPAERHNINFPNQESKEESLGMCGTSERLRAGDRHNREMVASLHGSNYQGLPMLRKETTSYSSHR